MTLKESLLESYCRCVNGVRQVVLMLGRKLKQLVPGTKAKTIKQKLNQLEKEKTMPGHYGKKGKGKTTKMKKQAATAISMKKAGKKPKKKM